MKNNVKLLKDYIYCTDSSLIHYAQKEVKQPVIITKLVSFNL